MTSKRIILLILTILITGYAVFASAITEQNGWLLPHSSVNNENFYWDILSESTPNPYTTGSRTLDEAGFEAVSERGELFRLRNSLASENDVTINPGSDGFVFTHIANTTLKCPYSIQVQRIKWTKNGNSFTGTVSNISVSPENNTISFIMEAATWSGGLFSRECTTYYEYLIFFQKDEPNAELKRQLEPGDYYSDLTVNYEMASSPNNVFFIDVIDTSQSLRLKAVYGESNATNDASYSMSIQSTNNSYNYNLGDTTGYHDVASVDFQCIQMKTSEDTQQEIKSANQNKYKVILSPYPNLEDDAIASNENPYYFRLMNSEQQTTSDINTVYYKVYSNASGSTFTKYSSGGVTYNNTYVMTPTVEVDTLSKVGSSFNYQINWRIISTPIYIKALPPTSGNNGIRASGLYTSTIYFYVITNT